MNISPDPLIPNTKLKKLLDEEISQIVTPENLDSNNYSVSFYYIDNGFEGTIKTDIKAIY